MSRAATDGATTAGSASHRSVNVPDVTATRAKGRGARPAYECDVCGYRPAKWVGRCPECGEWGSVVESAPPPWRRRGDRCRPAPIQPARPIASYSVAPARARPTGVGELDRVLGGGLVPGGWCCSPASPGSASRPCCSRWPSSGRPARRRAGAGDHRGGVGRARCGCGRSASAPCTSGSTWPPRPTWRRCSATSTRSSPACWCSTRCRPSPRPASTGCAGGVTQVRAVTAALVARGQGARHRDRPGRARHQGRQVAGPRVLEHLVDVVLQFEGDKHSSLRMVRGLKNRFGAGRRGRLLRDARGRHHQPARPVRAVPHPHAEPVPGTCVTVAMEGRRALVTEVQALIGAAVPGSPRRTVSGLDPARLAMVLAVVQRRGRRSGCTIRRCSRPPSAASGWWSRRPTSACALAVASGRARLAARRRPGGDR